MNLAAIRHRELGFWKRCSFERTAWRGLHSKLDYLTVDSKHFLKSITHFDINCTENFLLTSDSEGYIRVDEIVDEPNGQINSVIIRQFHKKFANCAQWYPHDDGMVQVAYPDCVSVVDVSSMKAIESYRFDTDVYWTDWSRPDANRIAVGCEASSVRIVDIRSGSALQQITLSTPVGLQNNHATRVLWDHFDANCLFVGDSYGHILVYDVRYARDNLQMVLSDQNVCDAITCMQFTRDKMNLITCHGVDADMNLWQFRDKKLKNLNINYVNAYPKLKRVHKSKKSALYVKYQVFPTDGHIFRPAICGRGVDMVVNGLWTGEMVNSFTSTNHSRRRGVTSVTGTSSFLTLFTGGHHLFDTWMLDMHKISMPDDQSLATHVFKNEILLDDDA